MPQLILASTSPARLATLTAAGLDALPIPSRVDEEAVVAEAAAAEGPPSADATVMLLARAKAEAVASALPEQDALVFGGDSAFLFDGEIWGKPHTPARATERIRRLSGAAGVLWSGHWLIDLRPGHGRRGVGAPDSAVVHFARMTEEDIEAYVATAEPLEVAGSFTVDGIGQAFIDRVDGAPSCVVGLSVPVLRSLTGRLGVAWPSLWRPSSRGDAR